MASICEPGYKCDFNQSVYPDDHPYLLHTKIDECKTKTDFAFNKTESDLSATEINVADLKDSFANLKSDLGIEDNVGNVFFNLTKKIVSLDQN